MKFQMSKMGEKFYTHFRHLKFPYFKSSILFMQSFQNEYVFSNPGKATRYERADYHLRVL
jgi:hypothetical protein